MPPFQHVYPTASQQVAVAVLLVLAPLVGSLARRAHRNADLPPRSSFSLGLGICWIGVGVGTVARWLLLPEYPTVDGPTEVAALPFALVGPAFGGAYLWRLHRRGLPVLKGFTTAACTKLFAAALLASVVAARGCVHVAAWPAHRALPWGALIIEESESVSFIPADFTYVISAEMTEDQFLRWMENLALEAPDFERIHRTPEGHVRSGTRAWYRDGVGSVRSFQN